ncbi:MAG: PHP domain-containing protein, partial [Anaerolineae bacterium]
MARYPVDLHTHSTASDGMLTPTALVTLAAERGVRVIGLADHDTVGGIDEAATAGESVGVTVVPAVEFSTRHQRRKQFVGIHLLGYFIDHHHPALQAVMQKIQQARLEQKIRQIKKMQSFGFDVPVDEVLRRTSGVPGRPHIVSVLLERNPGRFKTVQPVFEEDL